MSMQNKVCKNKKFKKNKKSQILFLCFRQYQYVLNILRWYVCRIMYVKIKVQKKIKSQFFLCVFTCVRLSTEYPLVLRIQIKVCKKQKVKKIKKSNFFLVFTQVKLSTQDHLYSRIQNSQFKYKRSIKLKKSIFFIHFSFRTKPQI